MVRSIWREGKWQGMPLQGVRQRKRQQEEGGLMAARAYIHVYGVVERAVDREALSALNKPLRSCGGEHIPI